MSHTTIQPEQSRTDTFAVFRDSVDNDLILVGRVDVPRYSQPNADGTELSRHKRLVYAVMKATSDVGYNAFEGEEFMVMTDMDEQMEFVLYDSNPTVEAMLNE